GRLGDAALMMAEVTQRAAKAFGADSLPLAAAFADLGAMQSDLKDKGAEASYARALAIREKALAPGDGKIAESRRSLARLLIRTGKTEAAITLLDDALIRDEKALGGLAPQTGDLAELFATQMMLAQRPEKAEPLFAKLVTIRKAGSGTESPEAADAMESHALALQALERLDEAEALRRSAMAIRLKSGGQGNEGAITSTLHLANLVEKRDRPVEAEALYKKALDAGLSALGPDHQLVAFSQLFLGMLLFGQNRLAEAEPLLKRGVAVMEKSGKTGGMADSARSTLALLMAREKRYGEAASLFETLLARTEKSEGPGSLTAARYRLSLATMLERQGKLDEAGEHVALVIPVFEAAEAEKPALASALATLGYIRRGQEKFSEAEVIFADVFARLTALYGENDRSVLLALGNLALAKADQGDDQGSVAMFERYVAGIDRHAAANAAAISDMRAGKVEDSAISAAAAYGSLIRLYARLGNKEPENRAAYSEKAFLVAQRIVESQAASALSQMAARQASGSGELASLLRSREDAVEAWQRADRQLTALRAGAAQDPVRERRLSAELMEKDAAIRAADARISTDFAGFGALSQPALPGFAAVQAALADNELALFYTDAGDLGGGRSATYLWAVPKSGEPVWVELERGSGEIAAAVRHMRGLLGVGEQTRGAKTLGAGVKTDVQADVLKAGEEIYKALLGPVAHLAKGKALVIVPTKRLAALPFQLLVSKAAPEGSADKYRDAGWLVKDHALTVMPSLAALIALKAPGPAAART
ncbi:MAG: tetratricopeptide repeat protein, partial [Rhizobiaceae bacterium]